MRRLVLVLAVVVAVGGCKRKRTDDRPEVDRRELEEESKRVAKGEIVGEPLRAPKIVVDAQQITINGYRVTGRRDLDGKLHRVEEVFNWMKGLREHWKMIHPGEDFNGTADVTVPENLPYSEGASLTTTIAFAGYPLEMTVHAGALNVTFDANVPMPPRADEDVPRREATLAVCKTDTWHARVVPNVGTREAALREAQDFGLVGITSGGPAFVNVSTPWQPVTEATLENAARTACTTEGCTAITIGMNGGAAFKEALGMLTQALKVRAQKRDRWDGGGVTFPNECTTAPDPAPSAAVPAGSGRAPNVTLRQGATQVNGRLPPEVIQRVVRQNFGRFRLCYENGLRTNPHLQGRVAVKLVIDEHGNTITAQDGGSDLPDSGVVSCVVRGFMSLQFPQPEKGQVTVVYPIIFSPGD